MCLNSEVDRDKVSGQASAEIGPPRSYNPNYRGQHASNSVQGSPLVERKEADINVNHLTSDTQKLNNPESSVEDARLMSSTPDIFGKSFIDVHDEMDDSDHDAEANLESKQNAVDVCKVETGSAFHVQGNGFEEQPSDGNLSVNLSDEFHKYSPAVSSDSEKVNSDVTDIRYKDSVGYTAISDDDSNVCVEREKMNCSTLKFSSTEDNVTTAEGSDYLDHFHSKTPSSEVSGQTPFAEAIEGPQRNFPSEDIAVVEKSTQDEVNISSASTSVDPEMQKNLINMSLSELEEGIPEGGNTAGDDTAFLSALQNTGDGFTSDFASDPAKFVSPASTNRIEEELSPGWDSETVGVKRSTYAPSQWTPMEIATATGKGECTLLEHPLKLKSTYTEVEDCTGTRDSNGEPLVTSYNRCFFGTVDYIWRSEGLQTVRVLAPIPKHAMQWTSGFPTRKWGSDHIALATELVFTKCSDQSEV